MVELPQQPGSYRRGSDKFWIGKARLRSITYDTYEGKVFQVLVVGDGAESARLPAEALGAAYGRPSRVGTDWHWSGKIVMMGLTTSRPGPILLIHHQAGNRAPA